ncbi:AI-2E family transporter [Porphyromonas circumdentaria]|uniref:Predicted PurR-regulated permease PerM n=1 Tax=Porphyromonas circumdentaria TaxID=29524 RepID=A0A1T4PUI2_9PORP|nr:AI-2E family transporter [Porphyromonas circumdentaria]MBB6276535.1 putative PurR-regulated permease PerM [Porphyromonas circumdentaria]MDO4722822.1 AI-2E family transporter [Porphyromonas circumdentaria]SJZ94911.1 Predicted PurR-regulated permease PerM [Porphyromonas circumdentaria]
MEGLKGISESTNKKLFIVALLAPMVLLFIVFGKEAWTYSSGFLGALTIFSLLRGQMNWLTKKKKFKRGIAATLLLLEAIFFFLIPLGAIISMLIDVFSNTEIDINEIYHQSITTLDAIGDKIGVDLSRGDGIFMKQILPTLAKLGQGVTTKLVMGVYSFFVNGVVLLFILFFMLCEQDCFEAAIKELLPFSSKNKAIVIDETKRIIVANAIGIPLLAIIQGAFAYVGYLIFGIEAALFYGVLTAFASIIPMLGTMVVWVPLVISLIVAGNWPMAIGLGIYGFLIIGGVDNLARFILQKKLADIHPLITVFGVILGLSIFGFWGIIFGPLLLSLALLLLNMFRHDYIPGSVAQPRITAVQEEKAPAILEKGINWIKKGKREKK